MTVACDENVSVSRWPEVTEEEKIEEAEEHDDYEDIGICGQKTQLNWIEMKT